MIPLVSIIIPTYNARHYVCDAVDSALAQTVKNIEVIVVDDGSTDGTGKVLTKTYGDRIKYFHKQNGGPASARNIGIRESKGDFIAFLDADDLWRTDKLELQLSIFDTGTLLVGSGAQTCNDGAVQLVRFEDLILGNRFANSGVVITRSALARVGGFDEGREFIAVEDWDMWLRLSKAGEIRFLHRDLIWLRVTENSLSAPSQADKMLRNEKAVLRKHLDGRPLLHARALGSRYLSAAVAFRECRRKSKALSCILCALVLFPLNLFERRYMALLVKVLLQRGEA